MRLLELPVIRELHARRLLFPVILFVCVAGVLVHGALTKVPSGMPETPEMQLPIPPITIPTLRPSLEKRPLSYQSDYWLQLAEVVQNKIIPIGPLGRSGIMVAPGVAIASLEAADELRDDLTSPGGPPDVITAAADPLLATPTLRMLGTDTDLGVALFAAKQPETVGNFKEAALASLAPGALVALVNQGTGGHVRIIPGTIALVAPASTDVDTVIEVASPTPPGLDLAAIVDLDGDLVGISIPADGGRKTLAADGVNRLVDQLTAGGYCQAIETGDLSDEALRLLGMRGGVLIERVVARAFWPEPSLKEGDVLLDWDGQAVASTALFKELYGKTELGKLVRFRVLRAGQMVRGATLMPAPDCRPARSPVRIYPALGLAVEWEETAWLVRKVMPDSPAAAAGFQDGDRITGAGGRPIEPRDASAFDRFERDKRAVVLTARRGDRVKMLAVAPGAGTN